MNNAVHINVVIEIIGRIIGWEAKKIQPMTLLDELGMSPYTRIVVLRELERLGRAAAIPDDELPGLVTASRSWVTVQALANAALDRIQPLAVADDVVQQPASPVAEPEGEKGPALICPG